MLTDQDYMTRALAQAERGRGHTSPNPMVGAVIVSTEGIVVGQGFHERAGRPHAEAQALAAAGSRARGATLYCTLEPCSHYGRTPPCAHQVVAAGIARAVIATPDPNPLVNGRGLQYLRDAGVQVAVGLGELEARRLNQPFITFMRERRPFVILKAATSLDGCIAARPGVRTQLTSAEANRHTHVERAEVDAIGVGIHTVLVDNPELTPRGVYRELPLTRVVFDRRLRTPPAAKVLSTVSAGPVIIVCEPAAAERGELRQPLEDAGATIDVAEGGSFRAALQRLAERDIESLVLEGGATVHRAAWDEGVVDYVRLYVTPHVLGAQGVRFGLPSAGLQEQRVEQLGPDVLIEGYVHGPR